MYINGQRATATLNGLAISSQIARTIINSGFIGGEMGLTLSSMDRFDTRLTNFRVKVNDGPMQLTYSFGDNLEGAAAFAYRANQTTIYAHVNLGSSDWLNSLVISYSRRPKKLNIDKFFNVSKKDGGDLLTIKDSNAASDLLETVLKTGDCFDAITKLLDKLGTEGNPILTNNVMRLFNDINSQTIGGFRFDKSSIDLQNEYREVTGNKSYVAGTLRGATFRSDISRGFNGYLYVFPRSTFSKYGQQHMGFESFLTLIHELAHLAGSKKTYSEGEINDAGKALGAEGFNDYIEQHCVPKPYRLYRSQ